ncbi:MAG: cytochrome-c oxidase [Gammaproteobacteria bacterium]|jgi:hypothetical protein
MRISMRFLLLAAVYGLCGMIFGMVMGAKENFTLAPVHAHLNLLGWVAITLYGLTYEVFPEMGRNRLARIQFFTVNAGVLILIPSLVMLLTGHRGIVPVLAVGEVLTVLSLLLFFMNLWQHRRVPA